MTKLERRMEELLPFGAFVRRMVAYAGIAFLLVGASLVGGILGYHHFEGMSWIDAFVNACMIMGGMGPVGDLHRDAGKIFAGIYALYCGMVLLISVGILATPLVHRFLHRFHLEIGEKGPSKKTGGKK